MNLTTVLALGEAGVLRTMAMATRTVASPSFLVVSGNGAQGRLQPFVKLGVGTDFHRQSRLSCGSVLAAALSPASLYFTTRAKPVCRALQTNVLVEESGSTEALEKLKKLVDLEGGQSEAADDQELLRFLRAKSFNAEQAASAFASHQKWRLEFVPKGYFTEDELLVELEAKKSYWISTDRQGCPALLTLGRNHFYNKDFDAFKRFIVYAFDRLIREAPPNEEKFICIVDLQGLGFKNLDSKSFIAAFDIMQKHYPGRLHKVFMINVPLIFNGLWKVVKPFIDEDTRNRIEFVDKNKLEQTLSNEIDLKFLPKEYGGQANLLPLQDAVTPNWPP